MISLKLELNLLMYLYWSSTNLAKRYTIIVFLLLAFLLNRNINNFNAIFIDLKVLNKKEPYISDQNPGGRGIKL